MAVLGIRRRGHGEREMVARTAARSPPPTRAGGQDGGSYTNSLKILPILEYREDGTGALGYTGRYCQDEGIVRGPWILCHHEAPALPLQQLYA